MGTVIGSSDRTEQAFLFSRRLVGKTLLGSASLAVRAQAWGVTAIRECVGLKGDLGKAGRQSTPQVRSREFLPHLGCWNTSWDSHVTFPAQGTRGQQMWGDFVWQSSCRTASCWGKLKGVLFTCREGHHGERDSHREAVGGGAGKRWMGSDMWPISVSEQERLLMSAEGISGQGPVGLSICVSAVIGNPIPEMESNPLPRLCQLNTSQNQRCRLYLLCFITEVWYLLLSVLRIPTLWGIYRGN